MAAYAGCVRDGLVLPARSPGPGGVPEWVPPGGGLEHGEDPCDTVVRELAEETGYRTEPTAPLGVDSPRTGLPARPARRAVDHHGVRLVYEGWVTGGTLRPEVGGSTGLAAWPGPDAVPGPGRVPPAGTHHRG
ncbi:NUDIX hydrolase [Streptomyces sp. AD55]|uniref:NUDIX hydrolase n=1 Tax=Streptomyces sp. AD55 TaxID=3242895 RepID=UPI003527052A